MRQTIANHPRQLAAQASQTAAKHRTRQAKADYLPSVDVQLGYGEEYSDNATTRVHEAEPTATLVRQEASFTLSQILFDGFHTRHETAKQTAKWQATVNAARDTANTLALEAADAYLEVLTRRGLLELAKDNLVAHQKIAEQIHSLTASGAGQRADLLQAESRLALATANLMQAEGNVRDSETAYLRAVGTPASALVEPDTVPLAQQLPPTLEAAAHRLDTHPRLQAARLELQAAQEEFARTGAAFWPKFKLELHAAHNDNLDGSSGENIDHSAMVRMQYNLYRGGGDQAKRREAAALIESARQEMENTRRTLQESLHKAWNHWQTQRKRVEPLKKHSDISLSVVQAYRQQFHLGRRGLLDVLDSEREWHAARAALLSAERAEQLGVLRLLASQGDLLARLGVQ